MNIIQQYYIVDNKLSDYIIALNSEYEDIGSYIKKYDLTRIMFLIDKRIEKIKNRDQEFYRIFNGNDIFWAESDQFNIL